MTLPELTPNQWIAIAIQVILILYLAYKMRKAKTTSIYAGNIPLPEPEPEDETGLSGIHISGHIDDVYVDSKTGEIVGITYTPSIYND